MPIDPEGVIGFKPSGEGVCGTARVSAGVDIDGSGGSLQLVVDDGTITKVLFFEAKD